MKWVEKPVKDILIGDHIYSEEGSIPHSLVEKIDGNTLKVICCIDVENEKTWVEVVFKVNNMTATKCI